MRKIIQIIETQDTDRQQGWMTALCDDGTVWFFQNGEWHPMKQQIPQDKLDYLTPKY